MLNACRDIKEFISDMDFQAFESDLKTQSAVQQQLIVLGRCVENIGIKTIQENLTLPYDSIIELRNDLIEKYWAIDQKVIWNIASQRIDEMIPELEKLLKA
jgi:uncharacterized protein with HEPN domain